jgi:Mlc titration factor MtfA (ptsG expression regulator)
VFVSQLSSFAASALRGATRQVRALLPASPAAAGIQPHWRAWLREHVPIVSRLPKELRERHEALVREFVAHKPFIGCAGFEVTEQARVVVAGHACLLILSRGMAAYRHVREVLVYPGAFAARRASVGPDQVVWEHVQVLHGESSSLGQVVLSWEDIASPASVGHNLVAHEFAHQLDQAKGKANGAPFLVARRARRERWAAVMNHAFEQHRLATAYGEPTLLSAYGATDPAEFFAVSVEAFFEMPQAVKYVHPALYAELGSYFGLDPAAWVAGPGPAAQS